MICFVLSILSGFHSSFHIFFRIYCHHLSHFIYKFDISLINLFIFHLKFINYYLKNIDYFKINNLVDVDNVASFYLRKFCERTSDTYWLQCVWFYKRIWFLNRFQKSNLNSNFPLLVFQFRHENSRSNPFLNLYCKGDSNISTERILIGSS